MKTSIVSRMPKRFLRRFNLIGIHANSVVVAVLLAAREVHELPVRAFVVVRRVASPRRVAAAAVLAVMIVTPTVLFLVEKARHQGTREAYRVMSIGSAAEASYLQSQIDDLLLEQTRLSDILLASGHPIYAGKSLRIKVVATGYSSSVIETDDTPFITAANTRTRHGVIALSRDLLRAYTPGAPFTFGDRVRIRGVGDFVVEDSMGPRWVRRADVWFPSRTEAFTFGIREVYLTKIEDQPLVRNTTEISALPSGL